MLGSARIEFTEPNSPLTLGLSDAFLARHSHVATWHDPRAQQSTAPIAPPAPIGMPAPLDASGFGFGPD